MSDAQPLSVEDRFAIFEQMNLHQQRIDAGWGRAQAEAYCDLYWPEGKFTVIDLRHQTFEKREGLKQMYDFAHSVFPIEKWSHDLGAFRIEGSGNRATAHWRWIVNWRNEISGVVSRASTTTFGKSATESGSAWSAPRRSIRTGRHKPFSRMSTASRSYFGLRNGRPQVVSPFMV